MVLDAGAGEKMTRIEWAVKIVSDLYDFYRKIPKVSSQSSAKEETNNEAERRTEREGAPQPSGRSPADRR
jgi:hypothetical protein